MRTISGEVIPFDADRCCGVNCDWDECSEARPVPINRGREYSRSDAPTPDGCGSAELGRDTITDTGDVGARVKPPMPEIAHVTE